MCPGEWVTSYIIRREEEGRTKEDGEGGGGGRERGRRGKRGRRRERVSSSDLLLFKETLFH